MIPLQLTLKNFLSYRETTLDFRGLHTACICGANGAGKSSLLEAITWVIWGQSRAASDDDIIHAGAEYVRVDFQFSSNSQIYRVIRARNRGRNSSLEFQIENGGDFRSVTAKSLRATQEQIISYLKLDYDTFINSAYLRQGRADEFMLRRPNERKQILADLLKLDRYEQLAEQAKDISKQFKGQAEQLELSLQPIEKQLEQKDTVVSQLTDLEKELIKFQLLQESDREKLLQLQAGEHQRQSWYQQLTWQQTQYQNLLQDCERLKTEQIELKNQIAELEKFLDREPEIIAEYQQLLSLQQEEETLSLKFQAYQDAQQHRQELEQQLIQQTNELNLQIQQRQTRLESLQQQEQELQQILSRSAEIQAGLEQLRYHRQRLRELDDLQHQVSPLLQRRYTLQTNIERVQARLTAQLEQLRFSEAQYLEELAKVPEIRQAALAVDAKIQELEKKQVYQKRIEEKGQERKSHKERLQTNQKICEEQLEELKEKLKLLQIPNPICPLCEQSLDEHYRHNVIYKTRNEQQEIQEQIWSFQEQITAYERDLQNLRIEYKQLQEELTSYTSLQQQFGQLEAQLEAVSEVNSKLKQVREEIARVEYLLSSELYAQDLQTELQLLNQEIQRLNYDEQTHALVRGEVEKWRWAEIKQAKLDDASRRQSAIDAEKPQLVAQIERLQTQLNQLRTSSEIQRQIERLERYLNELGYERSRHQNLINSLRQAQPWQLRYQELKQAKQQYPQLQNRLQQLEQLLQVRLGDRVTMKEQLDSLIAQMEKTTDNREEIQALEAKIQQQQRQIDEFLAQQGRWEQTLTQLENLQIQYEENCKQLKEVKKQYRIYQELAQAFGKNGIQTLMIENILPQLEAETNQILARLTGNQLHVQFLTQKAGRSNSKRKNSKLIDTLDILIADARGTRAYETYSGGEAFRINFSIRLALARLLAQRAGTALQLLIVDEGFGTQDSEGCDRLIAAINAIAADFACILTVTHMPQFKEAFQHRIEVRKTERGSQLILSN
ncbi:ATP-binding cassette family protein [Hydrococcus rivularis NIES-593]|uniref:Nuclease SbcCD subunit C n=1 Tax=Hydrococcus rivularis NIES-593 TaxID=1921803 RepID=A0A1U7HRE8_9CYAN|nr:exonuclease subunit SbcC [Hydrococcus rivularis]OKH26105.1 ATP-binding cassette family protein [Hydrococcus rivularis NIES-593]